MRTQPALLVPKPQRVDLPEPAGQASWPHGSPSYSLQASTKSRRARQTDTLTHFEKLVALMVGGMKQDDVDDGEEKEHDIFWYHVCGRTKQTQDEMIREGMGPPPSV